MFTNLIKDSFSNILNNRAMEVSELKNRIIESFSGTKEDLQDVLKLVENSRSVFPFNEIEFLVCSMIEKGGLTYNQYIELRSEYIKQNEM